MYLFDTQVLILEVLTLRQYRKKFARFEIVEILSFSDDGRSFTGQDHAESAYEGSNSYFTHHHYVMHGDNKGWLTQYLKDEPGAWED